MQPDYECEAQMFTDPGLVPGPGTNLDAWCTVSLSAQLGVLGNGPPTATDARHPPNAIRRSTDNLRSDDRTILIIL